MKVLRPPKVEEVISMHDIIRATAGQTDRGTDVSTLSVLTFYFFTM